MNTMAMPSSRSWRITEAAGSGDREAEVGLVETRTPPTTAPPIAATRRTPPAEPAPVYDADAETPRTRAPAGSSPVDAAPVPGLAADEQVPRHRQVGAEVDLLVDRADPERLGLERGADRHWSPAQSEARRVGRLDSVRS